MRDRMENCVRGIHFDLPIKTNKNVSVDYRHEVQTRTARRRQIFMANQIVSNTQMERKNAFSGRVYIRGNLERKPRR